MHAFVHGLESRRPPLLVGDVRQHHAVDAGRPYQQLQAAGMETARLETSCGRETRPFKAVVEQLSRGEIGRAWRALGGPGPRAGDRRSRRTARRDRARLSKDPDGTLVVSPDNQSRVEINTAIHRRCRMRDSWTAIEHRVRVLVPRQDVTGADRQWAERYGLGDVVRYTKGSDILRIRPGDYGRIAEVDGDRNRLTVRRARNGEAVEYDPRRLQGVTVYREQERAFATGDRVQITAA